MKREDRSTKAGLRRSAELGEVVIVAFDQAARYSTDPRQVARLATLAVALMLRARRGRLTASFWPSFVVGDPS